MNIKDLFDTAENGTLTFEQFESISKEKGAKFVDLKEGGYVSKPKYDDDIKAKEDAISKLNETISQRDTDLAELQTQLENAGTDANKLSELQTSFDDLKSKYTAETQAYQKQLEDQRYEFACREFANGKKFTSNAAKRDFTSAMIGAKLKYDADKQKILGAEDFANSYSEDNADAFVVESSDPNPHTPEGQPKPYFVQSTNPGGGQPKQPTLTELMIAANELSK